MRAHPLRAFLRHLRESGGPTRAPRLTDRQLLERFAAERDAVAFETLLARHGPMVLDVCRRALPDPNDAEDAFQATFLVLVRKAGSIRKGELLANWLYGVARRTAARAKVEAARRRAREGEAPLRDAADPLADMTARELLTLLDEELCRLSPPYRAPLLLCYLQGRTRDEAARQLGCSLATVDRRLERARKVLRTRLARRGVVLPATLSAGLLVGSAGAARLPSGLVRRQG